MLKKYIEKRIKQGTVILCFKILLDNLILNGRKSTMTKSEINKIFDDQHKNFGVGTFRSDYLLRQTSKSDSNAIGVMGDNSTFYIREEFIEDISNEKLKEYIEYITTFYDDVSQKNKKLFEEIGKARELNVKGRKEFILKMLLEQETGKRGQSFEVTSFAILRSFYRIRGFELNRFSTVYSNDGGIDFTSQMAVYQVTTKLSNKKFDDDIDKAPLKDRVFVYKEIIKGFDLSRLDNDLVLDHISSDDLIIHLEYLLDKRPEKNSKMIIDTMEKEFEREYYL